MTRSELPFDSAVATGKGDDGTTGLLFGGARVRKDDLRTEAYGTVDETVAALGLARAELDMKEQYGVLSPNFGGLGEHDPAAPARAVRRRRGAGDEARGGDAAEDGVTRVSRAMVDALGDDARRGRRPRSSCPREFVVPGRDPGQRRARAGPHDVPPRRAPHRDARRRGRGHCRWPYPCLSEPPGGPPVGPRPGGGAGRVARSHRRQAGPHPRAPSRRIDDRHARERNR